VGEETGMKVKPLFHVLLISCTLMLIAIFSLWHVQQVSLAQGNIDMTKTLNRSSNVVRVGEILSFTIALTNNSSFSLTSILVVDDYNQDVLAFAGASRTPDGLATSSGRITWDVAPVFPGQNISFTVAFTAEHPEDAVVNYARAEDVQDSQGNLTYTGEASRTNDAIGGAAPIFKSLHPPDANVRIGMPVTFTHIITNDGAAVMTRLPLTDTYDPAFLEFNYAIPVDPAITQPLGTLVWPDLTTYFGDIPPFATIVITTVFTATMEGIGTNRADTQGAIDIYNNDLTAGATQVPITIIGDSPEAAPTPTSDDDDDQATPTATATPFPTPTPAAITTTTTGPLYLPETGWHPIQKFAVPILGLALLVLGWTIVTRPNRP
jgi:uncharacterized repeat protein (TIGR01451 family)